MATASTTTASHVARAIRLFEEPEVFLAMARGEAWPDEDNPPAIDITQLNIGTITAETYSGASLSAANTKARFNQAPFLGGVVEYKVVALSADTFEVRKVSDNSLVGSSPLVAQAAPRSNIVQGLDITVSSVAMVAGQFYTFKVDGPVGFKTIENKYLVVPDPAGTIDYRGQKWLIVSPSDAYAKGARYVYMQGFFRYDELPLVDYRQVGVFTGLVRADGVPSNQAALLPAEVETCGALELLDNRPPVTRNADQKEAYSYILEM